MTRRKKIIAIGASVLALGAGGAAIASATGVVGDDDENEQAITGSALEQAEAAALAETGEGRVTDTEVGDEESTYEVEVTLDNGDESDVQLDEQFNVVGGETDRPARTRPRARSDGRPPCDEGEHQATAAICAAVALGPRRRRLRGRRRRRERSGRSPDLGAPAGLGARGARPGGVHDTRSTTRTGR